MAPVNTLFRLVFGGRLFDTESWSCTLHTDGNDLLAGITAESFQPALVDWITRTPSNISMAAHLDYIKFNRVVPFVLPTGKTSMRYASQITEEAQQLDMAVGTVSAGPGQLSSVVSLRTALSRGRASIGRIFPPTGGISTGVDGRTSTAVALAQATSAATLIRDINTVLAGQGTTSVVVFSNIGQVVNNVQTVSVGRVVDTLRSRRASLEEEPESAPVNP